MNRENMQKLIDALKAGPLKLGQESVGFNMNSYIQPRGAERDHSGNECGTVACLAGWVTILSGNAGMHDLKDRGFKVCNEHDVARDWLGLRDDVASVLFMPLSDEIEWRDITLADAITTLKEMIASPEANPMPDWSHVVERAA